MASAYHRFILRCASLGLLVFLGVTFLSVTLRFGFNAGYVVLDDLQRYAFTTFVPFAILYAALKNKHVRADIPLFKKNRYLQGRLVPLLFVVLPCAVLALLFLPVVLLAWQSLEGSSEPQGLGGYFLVKTVLPIVFGLIAFNGVLMVRAGQGFGSQTSLSVKDESAAGDD